MVVVRESALEARQIAEVIDRALAEDVEAGEDVTAWSTIPGGAVAEAMFLAKADGVVAGVAVATRVFAAVDRTVAVRWFVADGDRVRKGDKLGEVAGSAHAILRAERVALNLMQRMSGVATATRAMMDAVRPHKAVVLDTRKTVPGLRHVDKLAVRMGGGMNHRVGLWDMVLIKDNHVDVAGGVANALEASYRYLQAKGLAESVPVEIEVRSIAEMREVLAVMADPAKRVKVDRMMLDNFTRWRADGSLDTSLLRQAVVETAGRVALEASGNVTIDTIHDIAAAGVDFISSGALHHSVVALDISMKISKITAAARL